MVLDAKGVESSPRIVPQNVVDHRFTDDRVHSLSNHKESLS